MTEQEKMLAGDLYFPSDKTLSALRKQCRMQLDELNTTCQSDHKKRTRLLKALFGSTGKRLYIESSFKCDYGENIHVGENFFANFNCVILDAAKVTIGDNCDCASSRLVHRYAPIRSCTKGNRHRVRQAHYYWR